MEIHKFLLSSLIGFIGMLFVWKVFPIIRIGSFSSLIPELSCQLVRNEVVEVPRPSINDVIPPEVFHSVILVSFLTSLLISKHLEPSEILKARRVSRQWKASVDDSDVWQQKYQDSFSQSVPIGIAESQVLSLLSSNSLVNDLA